MIDPAWFETLRTIESKLNLGNHYEPGNPSHAKIEFFALATHQIKSTKTKTYISEDSLVVTHPTTNSPACGLSTAERTGSPVLHTLWSYVQDGRLKENIYLAAYLLSQ